jgi:subtilisin family serine protease
MSALTRREAICAIAIGMAAPLCCDKRRRVYPPPSPDRGHGTHVASILAGRTFGVARAARVHALRILPCTGTTRTDFTAAVRAVEWITSHGARPAVVNISPARWDTADRSLDEAIAGSIRAGFVYVLSAGGIENLDAYSPQRVADAITVGSTDASDVATQGGYGPHLTIFAPGMRIQGAGGSADTAEFSVTATPMRRRWSPARSLSICSGIRRPRPPRSSARSSRRRRATSSATPAARRTCCSTSLTAGDSGI